VRLLACFCGRDFGSVREKGRNRGSLPFLETDADSAEHINSQVCRHQQRQHAGKAKVFHLHRRRKTKDKSQAVLFSGRVKKFGIYKKINIFFFYNSLLHRFQQMVKLGRQLTTLTT